MAGYESGSMRREGRGVTVADEVAGDDGVARGRLTLRCMSSLMISGYSEAWRWPPGTLISS